MMFAVIAFPRNDDLAHVAIVREHEQGMQMIGHDQKQTTIPPCMFVIETG
jgi:hypothetical protein